MAQKVILAYENIVSKRLIENQKQFSEFEGFPTFILIDSASAVLVPNPRF